MADILPDCMMPDGADPCLAYQAALERVRELEAEVERGAELFKKLGGIEANKTFEKNRRRAEAAEARVAEHEKAARLAAIEECAKVVRLEGFAFQDEQGWLAGWKKSIRGESRNEMVGDVTESIYKAVRALASQASKDTDQ